MKIESIFTVMLVVAAWQDIRMKSIDVRLLLGFGCIGVVCCALVHRTWHEVLFACGIGAAMLALSFITNGAIGEGDGWFFVVSGMYLSWEKNLFLFLSGILLCFACGLPLAVKAVIQKGRGRKRELPFLPFLLPVGIWIGVT